MTAFSSWENLHLRNGSITEATTALSAGFERIEREARRLEERAEHGERGPGPVDRYQALRDQHGEGRGHLKELTRTVRRMGQIANFQRVLSDTNRASIHAAIALDGAKAALGIDTRYIW